MSTATSPGPLLPADYGSPEGTADTAHTLAELRDDACATLTALDAAAKARASIVRSCAELNGLPSDVLAGLKDLLRCITDQRKRQAANAAAR